MEYLSSMEEVFLSVKLWSWWNMAL